MNQTKLIDKLEGFRRRNSENHCYINKDVYRLLYSREFYYLAYNNIRNNLGAETKGSDGTSLHGFCEEWIDELISSIKDNSYHPQPNRITYIPKKNGKMRKLSFPNGKDKLIQEIVRVILECIYEPTFSNTSHGFRPNRSIHSAIAQIDTWTGTVWLIEGDISACFDEVDHRILESILRERINDERFIQLINKLLKAGYLDTDYTFKQSKWGSAQGSCTSPIIANIYLDKLDKFMEMVIERDTIGKYRKKNKEYQRTHYLLKKAEKEHDVPTIKRLKKEMRNMPSMDLLDTNFRRIKYTRYADDFVVGLISSKEYAKQLKEEIKIFLEEVLHLRLNEEKTNITNMKQESGKFLGFLIDRKNGKRMQIRMDINEIIRRLHQSGFCDSNGYPIGNTKLFYLPIQRIITYGNQVLRGILNGKQGCVNYCLGWRIQYIIQFSIAKTIARKLNLSMKKIFIKFKRTLIHTYINEKGKEKTVQLALFKSFRCNGKVFFKAWIVKIKRPIKYKYDCRNILKRACYICGIPQRNKMFHRKRKSLIKEPYSHVVKEMIRINRRQLCLCNHCFDKVENNLLEFNQITRRKLV